MRSFLISKKHGKPILKWGMLKNGQFFNQEWGIPENHILAISPSDPYVILDVDRHGNIDGFKSINKTLLKELEKTFNYDTPSNGKHYWLKYTGDKKLMNKASGTGNDLRNKNGFVKFYKPGDIRDYIHLIKETSPELNEWLELLFCQGKKLKPH